MKKVLSLILCAVMLCCCLPLSAGAYNRTYVFTSTGLFDPEKPLKDNTEYIINSGVTMTIPSGMSLTLPTESMLRVKGTLVIKGDLILYGTASLMIDGEIVGGKKVSFNKYATGEALVKITYPSLVNAGLKGHVSSLAFYTADTPTADIESEPNDSWKEIDGSAFNADGGYFYAPLNSNFFVKVTFNEDPQFPKYDCNKFKVYLNGLGLAYNSGYYSTTLSVAGNLDFSDWTNDSDFYRTFKIQLPVGEGYEVVGRDYEVSSDGTVYLKYGTTFSFKVEIDEAYDMSDYHVYAYNGYGFLNYPVTDLNFDDLEMEPDAYGYYKISPVNADYTVVVMGVVKNETVNLISSIIETIRNVINMLKEFFNGLSLGGLFSGLGA